MGLKSNGYEMFISGEQGRETYILTYKGKLVGGGDLRKACAQSNANERARQRLAQFAQKNHTLSRAEARLRMFALDSKLTESDVAQHRP